MLITTNIVLKVPLIQLVLVLSCIMYEIETKDCLKADNYFDADNGLNPWKYKDNFQCDVRKCSDKKYYTGTARAKKVEPFVEETKKEHDKKPSTSNINNLIGTRANPVPGLGESKLINSFLRC